MSKFKVGDRVVMYDQIDGVIVLYEDQEEYPYLVWNSDIDDTEWCNESALQLVNTTLPITVYAVCDEKGEIKLIKLTESDAQWAVDFLTTRELSYSIRPFALIPINE